MKAAILYAQNELKVETVDLPKVKEHEVLVQVKATGICGSDIPRVLGTAAHHYPITLGHEFSGIIAEVGAEVTRIKIGDKVVGVPLMPCRTCEECERGYYAQCKHYSFVGSRVNGSWAQYVVMKDSNVIPIDPDIPFEIAAFVEPASVALHAIRQIEYVGGQNVAIIGAGTIGLLVLQWVITYGAKHITVFDINDKRLEIAHELGATTIINSTSFEDKGKKYSFVFEAAGMPESIRQSFNLVANKGKVCLVGTPTREVVFGHQEFELINRKEFILTGSWMSYSAPFPGEEWETTLAFMKKGVLRFDRLVDKTFNLEHIDQAFDLYRNKQVNGKLMITVNDL